MFSNPVTWPVLQIPVGLSIGEIDRILEKTMSQKISHS